MVTTQPLIMAATIRASTKGLKIIDEARRKKGWAKTEKAWVEQVPTSIPTLKRFWAGVAIQTEPFQKICEVVGIDDWELIADFEIEDKSPIPSKTKRLIVTIQANFEGTDKQKLDDTIAFLQKLTGDPTIQILDIDEGSIKLILGGSPEALERIEALFKSGDLIEVSGISIQDVHFLRKKELILLIKKNGGAALDHSFVNLSDVNLSGANLSDVNMRGANLSEACLYNANLSRANLSGADLFRANLLEADLSGADLSNSDLRRADLSETNLFGTNLSGADLSGADLSRANLRSTQLDKTTKVGNKWRLVWEVLNQGAIGRDLSGSELSDVDLRMTDLSGSNLSRAYLRGSELNGSNLSRANLSKANLSIANLSRADLSGANLSGATLGGSNLEEANLRGTNLSEARFRNNPGLSDMDKADMKKRGAIFEDSPESGISSFVKR
jgi:uncharacterized protein YjbI with pentapeptide repeats